jgi:hypothetical protein
VLIGSALSAFRRATTLALRPAGYSLSSDEENTGTPALSALFAWDVKKKKGIALLSQRIVYAMLSVCRSSRHVGGHFINSLQPPQDTLVPRNRQSRTPNLKLEINRKCNMLLQANSSSFQHATRIEQRVLVRCGCFFFIGRQTVTCRVQCKRGCTARSAGA